jgi:hypothetical protein
VIDHQTALGVEQARHDAADVERTRERREREIAAAEGILLIAARGFVVILEGRRDRRRIEPVKFCQRGGAMPLAGGSPSRFFAEARERTRLVPALEPAFAPWPRGA